jgi:hypothetical protein
MTAGRLAAIAVVGYGRRVVDRNAEMRTNLLGVPVMVH